MPKYVEFFDDVVEFPDSMSDLAIGNALRGLHTRQAAEVMPPPPSPTPWDRVKNVASGALGVVGMPARGLSMLVDEAKGLLGGGVPETQVSPEGSNLLTGSGINTPGLGEFAMQGLEDIADPRLKGDTQERTRERNQLLGKGPLASVARFGRAAGTVGMGAVTDPSMAGLGPLQALGATSKTAKVAFNALQRTLQAGIGIESIDGAKELVERASKEGWTPEVEDLAAQVAANAALVGGLELQGRRKGGRTKPSKPTEVRPEFEEDFSQAGPDQPIQPPPKPASGETSLPEVWDREPPFKPENTGDFPLEQGPPQVWDGERGLGGKFTTGNKLGRKFEKGNTAGKRTVVEEPTIVSTEEAIPPPPQPRTLEDVYSSVRSSEAAKKPIDLAELGGSDTGPKIDLSEVTKDLPVAAEPPSKLRSSRETSIAQDVAEQLKREGKSGDALRAAELASELLGGRKGARAKRVAEAATKLNLEATPSDGFIEPPPDLHSASDEARFEEARRLTEEIERPDSKRTFESEFESPLDVDEHLAEVMHKAHLNPAVLKASELVQKVQDSVARLSTSGLFTEAPKTRLGAFDAHGYTKGGKLGPFGGDIGVNPFKWAEWALEQSTKTGRSPADLFTDRMLRNINHEQTHSFTGVDHSQEGVFRDLEQAGVQGLSKQSKAIKSLLGGLKGSLTDADVVELARQYNEPGETSGKSLKELLVDRSADSGITTSKETTPREWSGETGALDFNEVAKGIVDGGRFLGRKLEPGVRKVEGLVQAEMAGGIVTSVRNLVQAHAEGGLMAVSDVLHVAGQTLRGNQTKASTHKAKLEQRLRNLSTGHLIKTLLDTAPTLTGGRVKAPDKPWMREHSEKLKQLEQIGEAVVPKQLHERTHHLFSDEVKIPGAKPGQPGSRPLTWDEKTGRFQMAINILQERAVRLGVIKVELAPFIQEAGLAPEDYGGLFKKAVNDEVFRERLADAMSKAETAALQRTKGLGPKSEAAQKVIAGLNAVPGSKLLQPFQNYTISNFLPNLLEQWPVLSGVTRKGRVSGSLEKPGLKEYAGMQKSLESLVASKQQLQADLKAATAGGDKAQIKAAQERLRNLNRTEDRLRGKVVSERKGGVYSEEYRDALATTGPLVVAFAVAARLARGEDGLDWNQHDTGEKDGKGGKLVRNIAPVAGPYGFAAMLGDYVARKFLGSDYYANQLGKKAAQGFTGGRPGQQGPLDFIAALQESDKQAGKVGARFMGATGASFAKGGWVGDALRATEAVLRSQPEKYRRPELTEKPSKDIPGVSPFLRGMQSNVPGALQGVQPAIDSTSGQMREKPALLDTILHGGASKTSLSPLAEFMQKHAGELKAEELLSMFDEKGDSLSGKEVLMGQKGRPKWDAKRYDVLRARLEKDVLPVINNPKISEAAKVEAVRTKMRKIMKDASGEANRLGAAELPEDVADQLLRAKFREKARQSRPDLFPKHTPSRALKKWETRKLQDDLMGLTGPPPQPGH